MYPLNIFDIVFLHFDKWQTLTVSLKEVMIACFRTNFPKMFSLKRLTFS
jgi:hypothetical protein